MHSDLQSECIEIICQWALIAFSLNDEVFVIWILDSPYHGYWMQFGSEVRVLHVFRFAVCVQLACLPMNSDRILKWIVGLFGYGLSSELRRRGFSMNDVMDSESCMNSE